MSPEKPLSIASAVRDAGSELLQSGINRVTGGRTGSPSDEVERSISVGCAVEELERLWGDPATRSRIVAELVDDPHVGFRAAPKDWGTEVTLRARGRSNGAQGTALVPSLAVVKVLHRFKSLAETGEIPTLEHNPSARRGAGDRV